MNLGTELLSKLCADVVVGHVGPSSGHRCADGIPFLMGKNVGRGFLKLDDLERVTPEFHRGQVKSQLSAGDVVVVRIGQSGQAAVIPSTLGTANCSGLVVIKQPRLVLPEYLVHFLNSPEGRRQSLAETKGSTRQTLNTKSIANAQIPVASLAEQRRIAEVLDRAERLQAKRRAALAHLDVLTHSIFKTLFGAPARDANRWPSVKVGDVAEIVTGYPFTSQNYQGPAGGIRLCRGANVMPGRLDWSDLACWPADRSGAVAEFNLVPGDIVLAMDRPWISEGFKLAEIRSLDCPALLVQRVARLRGKAGVPNAFLLHTLGQPAFASHCRPTETTIPHISPKEIRSFTFPFPPLALQQDFARRVAAVDALKSAHRASLAKLDELFACLQHRAFRGEL